MAAAPDRGTRRRALQDACQSLSWPRPRAAQRPYRSTRRALSFVPRVDRSWRILLLSAPRRRHCGRSTCVRRHAHAALRCASWHCHCHWQCMPRPVGMYGQPRAHAPSPNHARLQVKRPDGDEERKGVCFLIRCREVGSRGWGAGLGTWANLCGWHKSTIPTAITRPPPARLRSAFWCRRCRDLYGGHGGSQRSGLSPPSTHHKVLGPIQAASRQPLPQLALLVRGTKSAAKKKISTQTCVRLCDCGPGRTLSVPARAQRRADFGMRNRPPGADSSLTV